MLNAINFNIFKTQHTKNNTQRATNPFIARPNNLAPLACDTVCFSGSKMLNKGLFEAFDNYEVCQNVHDDASVAEKDLKTTLEKSLKHLICTKKNPTAPIDCISTRIKTPYSIKEKTASEFEHAITQEVPQAFNPNKAKDIKKALGDIIGARITLRNNHNGETSKIIKALIEEVEAGRLKIKSIENYEPADLEPKFRYFNHNDLKALQEAATKANGANEAPVDLKIESKKSGYTALHIDVDLSDDENYLVKNNGYSAEIQIIGSDVQKLKEVEDACYKLQQDKAIRAGHAAYKGFSSYFLKYYNDTENYPNIKKDFLKYTSMAYETQRKKEPVNINSKKERQIFPYLKNGKIYNGTKEFLTIEEAGLTGKIPPELDFNTLADVKYFSDGLFELTQNI